MTSALTSWTFPPALNTTFVQAFNDQFSLTHGDLDYDKKPTELLLAAVQNLTLPERVDSAFSNDGWGGDDAVVSVGDHIDGPYVDKDLRHFKLHCILCATGRVENGTSPGSITNACSNYTDVDNIQYYTRLYGPSPSFSLDVPDFDRYSSLTNDTVGICILSLPDGTAIFDDYAVPFAIQAEQTSQRKAFNSTHPTGVLLPQSSSTDQTDSSPPQPSSTDSAPSVGSSLKQDSDSRNPNLIVGVVVGVLAAASILMGLVIWLWTRRSDRKNPYGPTLEAIPAVPERRNGEQQNVPLRQVQAVVRRPDSSGVEVPPAYHEVVRAKETEP